MKFSKFQATALVAACLFNAPLLYAQQNGKAKTDNAPAANPTALLNYYELALDQVAQGHVTEARVILLDATKRYRSTPETAALLAYLLEKEGRKGQAIEQLQSVTSDSPLLAAYKARLLGSPASEVTVAAKTSGTTDSDSSSPQTQTLTSLEQTDARLSRLEHVMTDLVNDERRKAGLQPLIFSDELASVARAHAAEMRDKKYFAHESPTTNLREPMDRYIAALDRTPRIVAENIYRAWGSQHRLGEPDIKSAHEALMNSTGHRTNIMLPEVRRVGIGIVANSNGDLWLTQMFDKP